MWEEPDEIQDLSGRAAGFFEGKESKRWCEVSEAPLNLWHKSGYLQIVDSKILEIRKCGKVAHSTPAEPSGSELDTVAIPHRADPEPSDKRK